MSYPVSVMKSSIDSHFRDVLQPQHSDSRMRYEKYETKVIKAEEDQNKTLHQRILSSKQKKPHMAGKSKDFPPEAFMLPGNYPRGYYVGGETQQHYQQIPGYYNPGISQHHINNQILSNHLPNQQPSHIPNQQPSHIPNQQPSHIPNQQPNHIPNQQPNHISSQQPINGQHQQHINGVQLGNRSHPQLRPQNGTPQHIGPQGQQLVPQGQPLGPQGQQIRPQGQPLGPQGQQIRPQGQPLGPQGQQIRPQGQPLGPQGQQFRPQVQQLGQQLRPQGQQLGLHFDGPRPNLHNPGQQQGSAGGRALPAGTNSPNGPGGNSQAQLRAQLSSYPTQNHHANLPNGNMQATMMPGDPTSASSPSDTPPDVKPKNKSKRSPSPTELENASKKTNYGSIEDVSGEELEDIISNLLDEGIDTNDLSGLFDDSNEWPEKGGDKSNSSVEEVKPSVSSLQQDVKPVVLPTTMASLPPTSQDKQTEPSPLSKVPPPNVTISTNKGVAPASNGPSPPISCSPTQSQPASLPNLPQSGLCYVSQPAQQMSQSGPQMSHSPPLQFTQMGKSSPHSQNSPRIAQAPPLYTSSSTMQQIQPNIAAPGSASNMASGNGPNMGPGGRPHNMGPGPNMGPGNGVHMGPGSGPNMPPGSGPNMGPGSGPNMGPGSGPNMGPRSGPNMGPGSGPNMGPVNGMANRPGPNGPSLAPGPNGPTLGQQMPPSCSGPTMGPGGPIQMGPGGNTTYFMSVASTASKGAVCTGPNSQFSLQPSRPPHLQITQAGSLQPSRPPHLQITQAGPRMSTHCTDSGQVGMGLLNRAQVPNVTVTPGGYNAPPQGGGPAQTGTFRNGAGPAEEDKLVNTKLLLNKKLKEQARQVQLQDKQRQKVAGAEFLRSQQQASAMGRPGFEPQQQGQYPGYSEQQQYGMQQQNFQNQRNMYLMQQQQQLQQMYYMRQQQQAAAAANPHHAGSQQGMGQHMWNRGQPITPQQMQLHQQQYYQQQIALQHMYNQKAKTEGVTTKSEPMFAGNNPNSRNMVCPPQQGGRYMMQHPQNSNPQPSYPALYSSHQQPSAMMSSQNGDMTTQPGVMTSQSGMMTSAHSPMTSSEPTLTQPALNEGTVKSSSSPKLDSKQAELENAILDNNLGSDDIDNIFFDIM